MQNDEALPNGKTTPDDRRRERKPAPHNDDANAKSRR